MLMGSRQHAGSRRLRQSRSIARVVAPEGRAAGDDDTHRPVRDQPELGSSGRSGPREQ